MRDPLLKLETTLALCLAWLLVFALPLRHTHRLFGQARMPTEAAGAAAPEPRQMGRAMAMARRLRFVAGRLPWDSTCLVRAVAGALLLARRRIHGARIRFGVRKQDGVLAAHAWLLLGETTLIGGEESGNYVPIADLGQLARQDLH